MIPWMAVGKAVGAGIGIPLGLLTGKRILDNVWPDRSVKFSEAMQEREVATKERRTSIEEMKVKGRIRNDAAKNDNTLLGLQLKYGVIFTKPKR